MRIGIDVDDTISFTNKKMVEEAEYFDETYLKGRGFKNKKASTFMEMFYWNVLDIEAFFKYIKKSKFFLKLEVKDDANKYINKLYEEGHEIIFITRRKNDIYDRRTTKKWLSNNGFKYNKIIFGMEKKGKKCQELGVDFFIDNDIKNIKEALSLGVDSVLMKDSHNVEEKGIKCVSNWKEVYDYIHGVKL